jgi:hypothetical protein
VVGQATSGEEQVGGWDGIKQKNWRAVAFNYNGAGYAKDSYHTKFEAAYLSYKKQD